MFNKRTRPNLSPFHIWGRRCAFYLNDEQMVCFAHSTHQLMKHPILIHFVFSLNLGSLFEQDTPLPGIQVHILTNCLGFSNLHLLAHLLGPFRIGKIVPEKILMPCPPGNTVDGNQKSGEKTTERMVPKPVVNSGINYQPQLVFTPKNLNHQPYGGENGDHN